MKLRFILTLALVMLIARPEVWAEGLLKWPGAWVPFVERINPDDFLVIAKRLDLALTDTADLTVIQYSSYDNSWRSYTVKRIVGEGSRLTVTMSYETKSRTVILPRDIGDRLLEVLEFALTTQVFAPSGRSSERLGNVWINLKVDQQRTVAGAVWVPERCAMGFESTLPFMELMYRLSKCFEINDNPFEGSPLMMLDLAISNLRLSYPAKH